MRDIEFRGRDERGIWRFGSFAQKKINNLIYPCIFTYKEWDSGDYIDERVVEGNTVGQFTGLTDKNGTKIFEGDILNICKEAYPDDDDNLKEVTFDFGMFRAKSKGRDYSFPLADTLNHLKYEVVGNIYDK